MMIEDLFDNIQYWLEFKINRLPAKEQQIDGLLQLAQRFPEEPEHAIKLVLPSHDDPREIYFAWQENGYRMLFAFPMEDFGWPNPLVLSGEELSFGEIHELLEGICLEGRESDSFPIVMNGFRNVTSEVFGSCGPDPSETEAGKDYAEEMNDLLSAYVDEPAGATYDRLLRHFFEGVAENRMVPAPVVLDEENSRVEQRFVTFEDGGCALVIMVCEDNKAIPLIGIRELLRDCNTREDCVGILFNPGEDNCVMLSLELISAAIRAGYQIASEEFDADKEKTHKEE